MIREVPRHLIGKMKSIVDYRSIDCAYLQLFAACYFFFVGKD